MAPPLTLTRDRSAPSSLIQASGTAANASLTSKRSMSSIDKPVFASARRVDGGDSFEAGVVADAFVPDVRLAAAVAAIDVERNDLAREAVLGRGSGGTAVTIERVAIHVVAAQSVFVGHHLGADELAEV